MKKINSILLSLTVLMAVNLSAQVDVGCTSVNTPAAGAVLSPLSSVQPNYTRKNFGAALPANHPNPLFMLVTLGGDSIAQFNRNMANPFASGADETFNGGVISMANITPQPAAGNHEFCVITRIVGDTNPRNDTSCNTISYTGPITLSFESKSVVVNTPAPGTGNTLDLGTSLTNFTYKIKNNSSAAIPDGANLLMGFYIGSDIKAVQGATSGAWAVGADYDIVVSNPAAAPALPTVLGPFDLCAYTRMVGAVNDTICATYTMVGVIVSDFTPKKGQIGSTVKITGQGFDATPANNIVKFKGVAAKVVTASATELTVEVPTGAKSGTITVEVAGRTGTSGSNFVIDITSVDEVSNLTNNVFYNNNVVTYELNRALSSDDLNIKIFNASGQVVVDRKVSADEIGSSSIKINVESLTNGVYISDLNGVSYKFAK